jgi:hypothetical protein
LRAGFAAALAAAERHGRLPERPEPGDVMLIGVASHKLSRMITKDRITSFVRAPFTEYEAPGGPGEVEERPRGKGLRRAVGELLICPYCLAQWIGTAFFAGLAVAPRLSRFIAAMLSAIAVADFLQPAYREAEKRAAG